MLKMITSPMKEEFPRTAGEGTETVIKTKEVEIYISPPPTYPPIRTEGMFISSIHNTSEVGLYGGHVRKSPGVAGAPEYIRLKVRLT